VANDEMNEFPRGGGFGLFDRCYVGVHLPVHIINQALHFRVRAFDDQFHAPIREIFDISMNVVLHGKILNGIAEADPLNTTPEMTQATMKNRIAYYRIAHIQKYIV